MMSMFRSFGGSAEQEVAGVLHKDEAGVESLNAHPRAVKFGEGAKPDRQTKPRESFVR
jgi:hypothetical protein